MEKVGENIENILNKNYRLLKNINNLKLYTINFLNNKLDKSNDLFLYYIIFTINYLYPLLFNYL